jgi:hypothetical protein
MGSGEGNFVGKDVEGAAVDGAFEEGLLVDGAELVGDAVLGLSSLGISLALGETLVGAVVGTGAEVVRAVVDGVATTSTSSSSLPVLLAPPLSSATELTERATTSPTMMRHAVAR